MNSGILSLFFHKVPSKIMFLFLSSYCAVVIVWTRYSFKFKSFKITLLFTNHEISIKSNRVCDLFGKNALFFFSNAHFSKKKNCSLNFLEIEWVFFLFFYFGPNPISNRKKETTNAVFFLKKKIIAVILSKMVMIHCHK